MKIKPFVLLFFIILVSCNSNLKKEQDKLIELKNRELALKEKELELKEREIDLLKDENDKKPKELSLIYQEVKKSVYLIRAESEEGVSQGSAFLISPTGVAISNYHVFDNASKATAVNDYDQEFMITEIIKYDADKDYIIFRIGPVINELPYLKIANSVPAVGEDCFAVGNPKGLTQTLSKGLVSAIRENGKLLQTTAEITHGSSGGPLFNLYGEVVGITTSGYDEANLNFALNIKELPIHEYLNRQISKEINAIENVKGITRTFNKDDIEDIIDNYYSLLQNNEFDKLYSIYTETLKRYFSSFNISREEAILKSSNYDDKFGVIDKENSVRWDTVEIFESDNGNYIAKFIMDYTIERKNKTKPSTFILSIIMELNQEGKIYSIYENILSRK
jgi:serine protease Do